MIDILKTKTKKKKQQKKPLQKKITKKNRGEKTPHTTKGNE